MTLDAPKILSKGRFRTLNKKDEAMSLIRMQCGDPPLNMTVNPRLSPPSLPDLIETAVSATTGNGQTFRRAMENQSHSGGGAILVAVSCSLPISNPFYVESNRHPPLLLVHASVPCY